MTTTYAGETIGFTVALEDDADSKPQCPLPTSVTIEVKENSEAATLLAETSMLLQVIENGIADGGSGLTLQDSTKAWLNDEWRDACIRITAGPGIGQERRIKSNTATTLTIDTRQVVNGYPVGPFSPAVGSSSAYELHRAVYRLNWDSPEDKGGAVIMAVARAKQTPPNGYTSVEKIQIELEDPPV
jgi:hypothetical protein